MMNVGKGPVECLLEERLISKLEPSLLVIENESHRHKSRGEAESHFKVLVVSEQFNSLSVIDRHKLVHQAVAKDDGSMPCHSLSIKAMTAKQFDDKPDVLSQFQTPPCLGGSKFDKKT